MRRMYCCIRPPLSPLQAYIVLRDSGFQAPVPSRRGPQAALNLSYRSDRVTRDGPVALRLRAAKSGTRIVLDGHILRALLVVVRRVGKRLEA